jgi:XTP/dITP diphosphohydrolase
VRVVVATRNRDKARELGAMLHLPELELRTLDDYPGGEPVEETGSTLEDNARLKALAALRHTGIASIADDTGLEVDALGGAPGVHAARFAGPGARYADNIALLLERLQGVPAKERTARFRTVCLACFADGTEAIGEGVLEGRITTAPRGHGGFGYDPVFEVAGMDRTLAELDASEKNALSHRARAVKALVERLMPRLRA